MTDGARELTPGRWTGAAPVSRDRVPVVVAGASALGATLAAGVVSLTLGLPPIGDEPHHLAQIRILMRGEWHVVPTLTTIPGYHALIAGMGRVTGVNDVIALRLCSFVVSVCALGALFAVARSARDGRSVERLLQIALLPILFPLLFLLYTDIAALLFFGLAMHLVLNGRHWSAGAAATAALCIRQNYVVWAVFLAMLVAREALRVRNATTGVARLRDAVLAVTTSNRHWLPGLLRHEAVFVVAFVLFAVFLIANGGVAIGDRAMHPFPGVHLSNLYFALFLSFFLLLPLHVVNVPAVISYAKSPSVLASLSVMLPLFLLTLATDHPYNRPELNWWLHNRLLNFLVGSLWAKLAMFLVAAVTLLSLAATRLRDRAYYLVYPFAALSLIPSWQVEQRYYLCAFVLVLMFRVQRSRRFEWLFIAYLAAVTAALLPGLAAGAFFL